MPDFHWQGTLGSALQNRFPDNSIGIDAWRNLADQFAVQRAAPPSAGQCQRALDQFMQDAAAALRAVPPHRRECRVFVSHRQSDVGIAARIAYLATQRGYGYWLDVDDPALNYVNGNASISSPVKDMLIAAIIEMGLLNSSHCIAAMTSNSAGSKWIPYEFGRAKYRELYSVYSASWLQPGMKPSHCGEYMILATITGNETDITSWLDSTRDAPCSPPQNSAWSKATPAPLPTSP
jgi:hypothetical protein